MRGVIGCLIQVLLAWIISSTVVYTLWMLIDPGSYSSKTSGIFILWGVVFLVWFFRRRSAEVRPTD